MSKETRAAVSVTFVSQPQPLAFNIEEAAATCGVSAPIIRRALADGSLVAHYPTSRPVIMLDELRDWLESLPSVRPTR